jgi:hypothetical protein
VPAGVIADFKASMAACIYPAEVLTAPRSLSLTLVSKVSEEGDSGSCVSTGRVSGRTQQNGRVEGADDIFFNELAGRGCVP